MKKILLLIFACSLSLLATEDEESIHGHERPDAEYLLMDKIPSNNLPIPLFFYKHHDLCSVRTSLAEDIERCNKGKKPWGQIEIFWKKSVMGRHHQKFVQGGMHLIDLTCPLLANSMQHALDTKIMSEKTRIRFEARIKHYNK